jgi:hypothetical protein
MVRDEAGKFVKGHGNIGGGRKPRVAEQEIKTALRKALPDADVISKLADAVMEGKDWAIIRWLEYLYGKPIQKEEITGKDSGDIVIKVRVKDVE